MKLTRRIDDDDSVGPLYLTRTDGGWYIVGDGLSEVSLSERDARSLHNHLGEMLDGPHRDDSPTAHTWGSA